MSTNRRRERAYAPQEELQAINALIQVPEPEVIASDPEQWLTKSYEGRLQIDSITAAKFEISSRTGVPTGRFVYGRSYLDRPDAVEIDPIELTLGATPPPTTKLDGVYGALRDASPDYWGRLVIDRALQAPKLDEIDYLLNSADERAGALSFGRKETPPAPKRQFNQVLKLRALQKTAIAVLSDGKIAGAEAEQARRLLLVGTAMGGARPKAVVEDDDGLWIAKFRKPGDRWNHARVEHAYLRLAESCGITTSQSRVEEIGDGDVLLVKRFDREKTAKGYTRARMVSALTLLQTEDKPSAQREWSYPALAEAVRRVCSNPVAQGRELFKRMCFNALVSNLDDHPRNHAIIAKERQWKLSPAYDLTPTLSSGFERDLAMIAGDLGRRATAENLLSQARRFLVKDGEAEQIVSEMQRQVRSEWYQVARKCRVSESDCEVIRTAFENEGFSFQGGASAAPQDRSAAQGDRGEPPKSKRRAAKAVGTGPRKAAKKRARS